MSKSEKYQKDFDKKVELDRDSREVNVRMLRVDWLFQKRDKKNDKSESDGSFADLIELFASAPESIYKTDFVNTLVRIFWKRYRLYVVIMCLIPFIVYMFAVIIYFSQFVVGVRQDQNKMA